MVNVQEEANKYYSVRFDDEMRQLIKTANSYDNEPERESAIEELQNQPLSLEKLSRDYRNDYITWELLLGTGGPADRILVNAGPNGEILGVDYQYQDWGTQWTPADNQDKELVQEYAEIVGYFELDENDK